MKGRRKRRERERNRDKENRETKRERENERERERGRIGTALILACCRHAWINQYAHLHNVSKLPCSGVRSCSSLCACEGACLHVLLVRLHVSLFGFLSACLFPFSLQPLFVDVFSDWFASLRMHLLVHLFAFGVMSDVCAPVLHSSFVYVSLLSL